MNDLATIRKMNNPKRFTITLGCDCDGLGRDSIMQWETENQAVEYADIINDGSDGMEERAVNEAGAIAYFLETNISERYESWEQFKNENMIHK